MNIFTNEEYFKTLSFLPQDMRGFEKYIDSFLADQTAYKRKGDFVGENSRILRRILASPAVFDSMVDHQRVRQGLAVENIVRGGEVC